VVVRDVPGGILIDIDLRSSDGDPPNVEAETRVRGTAHAAQILITIRRTRSSKDNATQHNDRACAAGVDQRQFQKPVLTLVVLYRESLDSKAGSMGEGMAAACLLSYI
jgi:hypothetical protein